MKSRLALQVLLAPRTLPYQTSGSKSKMGWILLLLQLADWDGQDAGEQRWVTRRLSFASDTWHKLPCLLPSMAAAAAGKGSL